MSWRNSVELGVCYCSSAGLFSVSTFLCLIPPIAHLWHPLESLILDSLQLGLKLGARKERSSCPPRIHCEDVLALSTLPSGQAGSDVRHTWIIIIIFYGRVKGTCREGPPQWCHRSSFHFFNWFSYRGGYHIHPAQLSLSKLLFLAESLQARDWHPESFPTQQIGIIRIRLELKSRKMWNPVWNSVSCIAACWVES